MEPANVYIYIQNRHYAFTDPVRKAQMFPESLSTLTVWFLRCDQDYHELLLCVCAVIVRSGWF